MSFNFCAQNLKDGMMKKAFSLIELLISLIILAIILTFMLPIVTKKLKHDAIKPSSSLECKKFDSKNGSCLLCKEAKCQICNTSILEKEGFYVNPLESCEYQKCSDKFDLACSRCNSQTCLACKGGFSLIDGKCEITDTLNFARVDDLYITRKNLGDGGVLALKGVTSVPLGSYCDGKNQKCCWYGVTSNDCNDNYSKEYSGCNRTVCNYSAAKEICSNLNYLNLNWRLAGYDEMANLADTTDVNGLWFCGVDISSFNLCDNGVYTCYGASPVNNQCRSNDMWALDGQCGVGYAKKWNCGKPIQSTAAALSVRCVSEAK